MSKKATEFQKKSMSRLYRGREKKLRKRGLHPYVITGHTGWTDNLDFAFGHKNEPCSTFKKHVHDPAAPYDAYEEDDDTEEGAKSGWLKGMGR